jgi:uncharacterized protein (DUF1330 family)
MEGSVEPTAHQLEQLVTLPDEGPIVMINLLRYREEANYAPNAGVTPCSGHEAYQRYGGVALGQVAAVGGRVLWMGTVALSIIAPGGEQWDDAVLVEYPSKQAFLNMVNDPSYQACMFHRTAALADSRLIATRTVLPLT